MAFKGGGSSGLPDDGNTPPDLEADGYASVVFFDSAGRLYFFVDGNRYYVTGTLTGVTGSPIGLLLALTHQ